MSSLPPTEGTHTVQVSQHDGKVVLHFERPVAWCALDPATATAAGEAMARAAYSTVHGDTPTPEKRSQITEQIRVTLITRAMHILNSAERDSPRPDAKIVATRVVDEVLKALA